MLAEVKSMTKNLEDKKALSDYLKEFTKLSITDAKKLADDIRALNNPKLFDESIVKIVDFLPRDAEDLNKILLDISLSEEEANAILALVKKY